VGVSTFLEWRIGAFFLGAALGLFGIFLDNSLLVMVALVVLLLGVALRARAAREAGSEERDPGPTPQ
jgi:hypothetical protein